MQVTFCRLYFAEWILLIAFCRLHFVFCIFHFAYFKCILPIAFWRWIWILQVAGCILHFVNSFLKITFCKLYFTNCVLQKSFCKLHCIFYITFWRGVTVGCCLDLVRTEIWQNDKKYLIRYRNRNRKRLL